MFPITTGEKQSGQHATRYIERKCHILMNAYAVETGLSIGQLKIDEKINEIKGIPEMIEWLDLEGAVVPIDAIGCQKEMVSLLEKKG